MNQIEIFNSPEFGSIRVIEENGKYLFCGADVAKSLGYKDTVNALKTHCREDGVAFYHLTDNLGRKQKAKFISEGNLYRLIVHSKLPSAERFEKWVFDEVLPTIRKHGSYLTKEKLCTICLRTHYLDLFGTNPVGQSYMAVPQQNTRPRSKPCKIRCSGMMMLLDFILNGMLSTATSTKALPELRSISGMPLCG